MIKEDKNILKRNKILTASRECFARFGYDKTTMDDIAKAVGLNKATLYYYYKNKEEIFTAVILSESTQYINALQEKVNTDAAPDEKIKTYLYERLMYYREVINLHELSVQFLKEVEPMFDQLYQSVLQKEIDFVAALIEEGVQKDVFAPCESTRIAKSVFIVADAVKFRTVQGSNELFASKIDYSKIADELIFIVELMLNGIRRKKN